MRSTLTILHSNDLHSRLDAWPRVESIARRIQEEVGADHVLRLDAGDHGDRSFPVTEATRAEANVRLLAAARVDAFTPGNNECLVWPLSHQSELAQSAPFPVLAADLRLADGSLIPGMRAYTVLERAGLKVGIFGVSREVPDFLTQLGIRHLDPKTVAAECVRTLRDEGCDLIVLLSHLGYEYDRELAAAVPGIHVIVGGHSHTALTHGARAGETVIVQAGCYGEFLGRLDLTLEPGHISTWTAALVPTAGEVPDPDIQALLNDCELEAERNLAEVLVHLPVGLPHDPLGASSLAELLAERLRVRFGADLALVHGGVLLGGLPAGPVTRGDLLRICPCMLNPAVAPVPGRTLLALLALPDSELGQRVTRNGMRGDTVAGRLFTSGLTDIDPDRTYRVALNDYLAFGFAPYTPMHGLNAVMEIDVDQLLRDTLTEALTGQIYEPGEVIRVQTYKADGRPGKYWDAQVLEVRPDLVRLRANSPFPLMQGDKEVWISPLDVEYFFWPGRPYNQFRFYDPQSGAWKGDYFNVAFPFAARQGTLTYIDLELDVYVNAGEAPDLLDEDELEAAGYDEALTAHIRRVGEYLLSVAGTADTPAGPARTNTKEE